MNKCKLYLFVVLVFLSSSLQATPTVDPINVDVEPEDITVSPIINSIEDFSVVVEPVAAPSRPQSLISPAGDTYNQMPTFSWYSVSGATDYCLWVVDHSGFRYKNCYDTTDFTCNNDTCSVTPQVQLELGNGHWMLQSKNPEIFSSWSEVQGFNVTDVILGDTNDDGIVNIQDVISVINVVLGSPSDLDADINQDGQVNVQDVIFIINLALA